MPGMSGFEVVDKLKVDQRLCKIPVVVITAKDITDDERKHLNGGVLSVMKKSPMSQDAWISEVKRSLGYTVV
jgi:CheY-like chemotaxis protein